MSSGRSAAMPRCRVPARASCAPPSAAGRVGGGRLRCRPTVRSGGRATSEPGGSRQGEAIRRLLLEGGGERWDAIGEALLLAAARRDHVMRLITPWLEQGAWVVTDRFFDSTMAYQGHGRGVALDE